MLFFLIHVWPHLWLLRYYLLPSCHQPCHELLPLTYLPFICQLSETAHLTPSHQYRITNNGLPVVKFPEFPFVNRLYSSLTLHPNGSSLCFQTHSSPWLPGLDFNTLPCVPELKCSPPLFFSFSTSVLTWKQTLSSSKLCFPRDDCQFRTCWAHSNAKDPEHLCLVQIHHCPARAQPGSQENLGSPWLTFPLPCESTNRHCGSQCWEG